MTYDEGSLTARANNTMLVALGPQVHRGIYAGPYSHYSTVLTVEQRLGLPCLAHACGASPLPVF